MGYVNRRNLVALESEKDDLDLITQPASHKLSDRKEKNENNSSDNKKRVRWDLNPRPPVPETGALSILSYEPNVISTQSRGG